MNRNILKYALTLITLLVIAVSCDDEGGPVVTEKEETLAITSSGNSSIVLNFSYPTNPAITLNWAEGETPASTYEIVFSSDEDFPTPVVMGSSSTNTFTITVEDLNNFLVNQGAEPYDPFEFYLRIETSADETEAQTFTVTTYAEADPSIDTPTNSTLTLDVASANDPAITISFQDFSPTNLGEAENSKVELRYTLQAALGGTDFATPIDVETLTNSTSEIDVTEFVLTNKRLNEISISAGIAADAQGTLDVRVRAVIISETGTQERISDPITLTVTTYNTIAPTIYLVGAGTAAGWNNPASPITNHHPLFPNVDNPNQYSYTGYFANDGFKVLGELGSWDNQWGTGGAAGELSTDGGSGNLSTGAAGYFTLTMDVAALTYSINSYDEASAPDYTANGMGITGAAVGGWDDPARIPMTQSAFDKHIWYATGVVFVNDEFKFKETNGWGVQFGANGGGQNAWPYDQATGGDNLAAVAGTYTVFFNDLTKDYWMIEE